MKGFTPRERRIIGAVYHDCERIALERVCEQRLRERGLLTGEDMAMHLAELMPTRKAQILKYGADLPMKRCKWRGKNLAHHVEQVRKWMKKRK